MSEIEPRRPGQAVTLQNRAEAEKKVDKALRKRQIIETLHRLFVCTAKEVATDMWFRGLIPSADRNFTAPRLTELEKEGAVEVVGTKRCEFTGRRVAAYKLTGEKFDRTFVRSLGVDWKDVE